MSKQSSIWKRFIGKVFSRGIVYNMSWEDPEVDRIALEIQPSDTVLTLTSGGCNTLSLLLLSSRKVISIDRNPAQTALLELKCAAIRRGDAEMLWDLFGSGDPRHAEEIYRSKLRQDLSPMAQKFWDRRIHWIRKGINRYGMLGLFLRGMTAYFRWRFSLEYQENAFACDNLDEQRRLYANEISPRGWSRTLRLFLDNPVLMYIVFKFVSRPEQLQLVRSKGGMNEYYKELVDDVMDRVLLRDNYFLSMSARGFFSSRTAVPPYLKPESFKTLQSNLDRLQIERGSIDEFLERQPAGSIQKFSLLDIFDWMDEGEIRRTWQAVLRTADKGARLIYRSYHEDMPLPDGIARHFASHSEQAQSLRKMERSVMYSGVFVGELPTVLSEAVNRAS